MNKDVNDAPVSSVTGNGLLEHENSICQAGFVVHFLLGMLARVNQQNDGIELSAEESCGLINIMEELSNRIDNLVGEVVECSGRVKP